LANLQGAVQRVIVNGEVFDKLMEVDATIEQQNVGVYRGPPCGHMPATHLSSSYGRTSYLLAGSSAIGREGSPCQNNGICQPLLASFVCKCLSGYIGKRCEKREFVNRFAEIISLLTYSQFNSQSQMKLM
jgi:coxsackievirus/adenovirus receptor